MKPLVRHHDNYTLRIRAQDRGFPINTAYQDVHICVTDFNDHAPRFVRPEQNTTIKVAENETVGFLIAVVAAVDEDAGLNSQIRYSLRPDPLGHWKTFAIDELSGDITLAQPLDREMQKLYEVITYIAGPRVVASFRFLVFISRFEFKPTIWVFQRR